MMRDLYWLSKNEDFKGERAFVEVSTNPKRSAEERAQVLIKKLQAQRRYEKHVKCGGTQLSTELPEEFNKKARLN
ncbi:hypothetical protein JCM19232_4957 [Vibrio ishigakensis]|uniref:Uncharacterized protein n=1 Tax=Vibrio ishigakensis TaxID=1481914 RepID=A0A0B8PL72_9VIBR|nr:hypothetical protein JCM19232_4957 [Vibrio ishigakensis]